MYDNSGGNLMYYSCMNVGTMVMEMSFHMEGDANRTLLHYSYCVVATRSNQ